MRADGTDGQTGRHDKGNYLLGNFVKEPKNETVFFTFLHTWKKNIGEWTDGSTRSQSWH